VFSSVKGPIDSRADGGDGALAGGTAWNLCARIFWRGGEESSPEETWMVIHRLVHLLPREYPARLPQLTRVGGPRRYGGGLTQKPCENSNLPGMLWVGDRNEERRRMVGYKSFEAYLEEKFPDSRRKAYYLMSIHDHLPQMPAPEIEELGWSKALELAKVARVSAQPGKEEAVGNDPTDGLQHLQSSDGETRRGHRRDLGGQRST